MTHLRNIENSIDLVGGGASICSCRSCGRMSANVLGFLLRSQLRIGCWSRFLQRRDFFGELALEFLSRARGRSCCGGDIKVSILARAHDAVTDAGYRRPLLQEFLLAIDVTSSGTPEEKLKWAFRMYDVDGNGVIDMQEMTKIVQVPYPMNNACASIYFHLPALDRKLFRDGIRNFLSPDVSTTD